MTMNVETNSTHQQSSCIQFMPQQPDVMHVLQERALLLAKLDIASVENTNTIPYVSFKLGENQSYGIPYHNIKEVIQNSLLSKVPCTPDYISGIVNHRGVLYTILNLRHLFQIKAKEIETKDYTIIINGGSITAGILTDHISGSSVYDPTELQPSMPSEGIIKSEYIVGIHNGTTAIINVEAILIDLQQQLK